MPGPKIYGGKKVEGQDARHLPNAGQQTDKAESSKGGSHAGLHKHMAQHGFSVNSKPGAPTVANGGWNNGMSGGSDSNATVTGPTNLGVGSKLRPAKPSNVYTSGDSVK